MIKRRLDIFITLVVKLCFVTAEGFYYPEKFILRGGNSEVSDILLRGNENPDRSTVISNGPKPILGIGNPAVATTHRDNSKHVAGGNPKVVIPIGNPAVAALLRNNLRDILRGGDPEISAMLRANPKPFLIGAMTEIPAMSRDELKHNLLVIPELSAMRHGNPKPNPYGGVPELLREYTKPLLGNRDGIQLRHLFLKSGNNKYIIKDFDLKGALYKMIDKLTKVNDERIPSLNKFFELENYLAQMSRTTKQKNPLIAIIMNAQNYKSKYNNLNINHLTEDPLCVIFKKNHKQPSVPSIVKEIVFNYNEDDDEVNISQGSDSRFTKDYLRAWKSCNKSASKTCQKACKKAVKNVCYDYRCSKSFKKDVKKQCKRRCDEKFNNGRKHAAYLGKPVTGGTYYNQIN